MFGKLVAGEKTSKQMGETCCNNEAVSGGRVFEFSTVLIDVGTETKTLSFSVTSAPCEHLNGAVNVSFACAISPPPPLTLYYLLMADGTVSFAQMRWTGRRKDDRTGDFCDYFTLFYHILPLVLCFRHSKRDNVLCVAVFMKVLHCFEKKSCQKEL